MNIKKLFEFYDDDDDTGFDDSDGTWFDDTDPWCVTCDDDDDD